MIGYDLFLLDTNEALNSDEDTAITDFSFRNENKLPNNYLQFLFAEKLQYVASAGGNNHDRHFFCCFVTLGILVMNCCNGYFLPSIFMKKI